jgi:hypothetical protein
MKTGTTDDEEWEQVQGAVNVYCDLLPDPVAVVKSEYRLWHHKWQAIDIADRPKTVLSALDHCTAYPNVSLLLQLLATIPVTTAEAERLFSKLERTLTAIRSTVGEQRLEALILLYRFIAATHHQLTLLSIVLPQQQPDALTSFSNVLR